MTVDSAPNVLVVQLKRFEFSLSGRKLSKPISFGESLDLSPYLSTKPEVPALYDLYGVLVHQGHSMHSGHYYCFVKGAGGNEWHKFDDTRVHTSSIRNVMGQLPYMLFYIKRQPQRKQKATALVPTNGQTVPPATEQPPHPTAVESQGTNNKKAPQENGKAASSKRPREADTALPEDANGSRKRQQKAMRQGEGRDPLSDGKGTSDPCDEYADRTFRRPFLRLEGGSNVMFKGYFY
jgi:ubiquitin carboxyl-terminal hydrolase 36/42